MRQAISECIGRIIKRILGRDPAVAASLYRREAARQERLYGPDDQRTLMSRSNYAIALHKCGNSAAAEAELAALIERQGEDWNREDKFARVLRAWHADILFHMGHFEAAERGWRMLSDVNDRVLGSSDPESLDAHQNHAIALRKLGRLEESKEELEEVVLQRATASGSDSDLTLKARKSYAEVLSALGDAARSENMWGLLSAAYDRSLGDSNPEALLAHEMHAEALYKLGRIQEAAAEFGKVAADREVVLGRSHALTVRAQAWRDTALGRASKQQ
jgi:tetratricopeptide (TPR) repeat protein